MSKEILSKEIYLSGGDWKIERLLEVMKEHGYAEAQCVKTCKTCKWWNSGRPTKNIVAECDFGNTITGEKFEKTKKAFYVTADADDDSNLRYGLMTGEDFGCSHHSESNETKKDSDKMEDGGVALDKELLDDIAWDLGISHQWIDTATGKWKSEGDKDKAYKLASVEAARYEKGGKIRDKKQSDGINWLITGE